MRSKCQNDAMTEPLILRRSYQGDAPTAIVGFTAMADGTAGEYAYFHRGDRNAPDRYRGHRWAGLCEVFGRVAWDPAVVSVRTERLS